MKNLFNSKSLRFQISKSRFSVSNLFANVFVKKHNSIVRHLIRVIYALKGKLTPNWTRLCYFFSAKCAEVYKSHGTGGLIKFLKVSATLLQQVPAGYKVPDVTPLGFRLGRDHSGLPKWIPSYQRKLIRKGDHTTIKRWLTLLNIYRVIPYEGKVKLSSIVKPFSGVSSSFELRKFIPTFSKSFYDFKTVLLSSFNFPNFPSQILTSAPQSSGKTSGDFSSNIGSAYRSLRLLQQTKFAKVYKAIRVILTDLNSQPVMVLMRRVNQYLDLNLSNEQSYWPFTSKGLGALRFKEEAAGKVRVFAMVDPWTQWALKPLHKALFKLLRLVPMDGTFDQLKPLKRIPWGQVPLFSFDLSAATDRLPLWIQSDILKEIFGEKFAQAWSTLLVDRDYSLPKLEPKGINYKGFYPSSVRYSVGQPMGALSSWAMLAITHHFIVQACAWRAGVVPRGKLFKDYALLGDDILIWNKPVALQYQNIMTQLGVEIGLSKSILSPKGKGLEFAKRTILGGTDVSPIPFKEVSSAHRSFANMRSFMDKYNLTLNEVIRLLGYGYKVDSTKNTRLVRAIKMGLSVPRNHTELISLFITATQWLAPNTYPIYTTQTDERLIELSQVIWACRYDKRVLYGLIWTISNNLTTLLSKLDRDIAKLKKYYEITETAVPVPFSTVLKDGKWTGLSPKWGYVNVPFILLRPPIDLHLDRYTSNRLLNRDWNPLEPSLFQWSVSAGKSADAYTGLVDLRKSLIEQGQVLSSLFLEVDISLRTGQSMGIREFSTFDAESLVLLLSLIFKAHEELDSYQVDKLILPEPSQGQTDPTFLEQERTLRLWNHWSHVISSLNSDKHKK
jgi:hypothetical protein